MEANMKNYLIRNYNNGFDMLDDAFEHFFRPMFYEDKPDGMNTDIKETDDGYALDVELPGFDKSEIALSLEKGYLTISAKKTEKEEDGKGKDKYLRRERKIQCSRSYYVGEGVTENDIKAKYENGVLNICVPKDKPKQIEAKKIEIE